MSHGWQFYKKAPFARLLYVLPFSTVGTNNGTGYIEPKARRGGAGLERLKQTLHRSDAGSIIGKVNHHRAAKLVRSDRYTAVWFAVQRAPAVLNQVQKYLQQTRVIRPNERQTVGDLPLQVHTRITEAGSDDDLQFLQQRMEIDAGEERFRACRHL